MKVSKKARKELKEIILKAMDDVYGFPKSVSIKKARFLELSTNRIADYFEGLKK